MASASDANAPTTTTRNHFEGEYSASDYARQHCESAARTRHCGTTDGTKSCSKLLPKARLKVSYLIRLGVDLDHSDDKGYTALHHAALSGFEDTVEVLLAAGCDFNAASLDHGTPLHLGAFKGRKNVVDRLLSYRAKVNAESRLFGSPLHCAAIFPSFAIASVLVKKGADVKKKSILLGETSRLWFLASVTEGTMELAFQTNVAV
ncbi:uncharacterized protein LTR77_004903 [Saxophila tyrrhenica]|uniref:Uncharacterized protein n=1 Tax=Saxophila tyrrhenica TaxID=1690608 RepID=A0AAV9PAH9_9PEZI|nr:hypothetical protein LTR77_004903 [Saxophila tyrrhenica]